jgi:hypothetical protein
MESKIFFILRTEFNGVFCKRQQQKTSPGIGRGRIGLRRGLNRGAAQRFARFRFVAAMMMMPLAVFAVVFLLVFDLNDFAAFCVGKPAARRRIGV